MVTLVRRDVLNAAVTVLSVEPFDKQIGPGLVRRTDPGNNALDNSGDI